MVAVVSSNSAVPTVSTPAQGDQALRRGARQHAHIETENALEGHARVLMSDRRTWLGRRESGTLDVTPPREGRFERFLS